MPDAVVIGAGPNGLVGANHLADAGWSVHVLEAEATPGGAVRSAELTEPGFVHDVFSAFYPLAAASPALTTLELERWGLRWRHGPLVVAHPSATEGTCVALSRDLDETAASLEAFAAGDGDAWRRLYRLFERLRPHLLRGMTTPLPPLRATAGVAAVLRGDLPRFVRTSILGIRRFAEEEFRGAGAARLLAGNALHADLSPEAPPGGFFGWFLTGLGQAVGYPFPEGGAQRLTDALVARLRDHGGEVSCGARVTRVVVQRGRAVGVETADGTRVTATRAVLADTMPGMLYRELLDPAHVPLRLARDLERLQLDAATFKLDWALDGPIPWRDEEARRAPVVHVADSVDELTQSTAELAQGLVPARPFLVFGQYALGGAGDTSRCPDGAEVAWAYTHLPHHVRGDAAGELSGRWDESEAERFAERMEERVEALAPGFRALVRARHVLTPRDLEERDANLVGGALNGGTAQLHQQLFFRPTPGLGRPETPVARLYLASAAAHPGG
ncbi:MAG TPA: NAD(P)/FAD-dependent oxidoreductase, partial [Gaiellaceae bacterium]|nr:NAD(P)/FAD-dependent oxidoreductase [Gaiellaceae bacterium]